MKIRTDFVTNSSSSSFTLTINVKLRNRKEIVFSETGDAECGYLMGIHCDATASK